MNMMNFSNHIESLFGSQIENGLGWPFRQKLTGNNKLLSRKRTSMLVTKHQHIWSLTSVTNSDVTGINRSKIPCEALHSFKHHFDQFFTLIYSLSPFQT